MSVSVLRPTSALDPFAVRKRTSSFSFPTSPRPTKVPRLTTMGALKRTETCAALLENNQPLSTTRGPSPLPSARSQVKDQRAARRRNQPADDPFTPVAQRTRVGQPQPTRGHRGVALPLSTSQSPVTQSRTQPTTIILSTAPPAVRRTQAPTKVIMPSAQNQHAVAVYENCRTNSPLAPVQTMLPARPVFPRSKVEPNLYKKALIGRMRATDEGRRVLSMGPRLAISVWMATKDLEQMVEDNCRREHDLDILMGNDEEGANPQDPRVHLSRSWVVVRSGEDWEMIDCAADSPATL